MNNESETVEKGPTPKKGGKNPARTLRPRRRSVRSSAAFVAPLAIAIALGFALNGTLTLLDPQYGIWSDALTATWGNQSFTLPGLETHVTVVRDGAGTVHIYASDDADLFYAQGFTQASDRLFQMEAQSLMAQGNLSSWLGPSSLQSDESFRYLGIPQAAAGIAAGLPSQDPAVALDLSAYSAGVNAYISFAESHNELPLPFKALGVEPFRWSPFASLCFERLMVLSQTAGIAEPLQAALVANVVGDAALNEMYPIYSPYYQNFTVMPGNGSLDNTTMLSQQGINASFVFAQDWSAPWATGIPATEEPGLIPLYRAALYNLSDPYLEGFGTEAVSQGVGSNSWVVAANRTGIGLPLFANDPHLPLQLPSLWIPTQLTDPSYAVTGWSLAGLPGILIGHDAQMAWGLTYSGGASALDYVETLNGDSYLDNGTWQKMTFVNQTLEVAGASPVTLSVPWTMNGPLVARIGDHGISIRWDGTHPTWEVEAEFTLDRSVSISQMFGVMERDWDIPTLNFMMAEHNATTGATHIGWIIPAHYHMIVVTMPNGQVLTEIGLRGPLNGSGGMEPVSTIAPALSPHVIDPSRGYLYAPNQASVGQDYPYPFIGGWWDPGGRAHTIGTYLNTHPLMGVSNMEALQANVTDSWAVMGAPMLSAVLQNLSVNGNPTDSSLARASLPYIQSWNGSFYANEVAPTIYSYYWNEILAQVYSPLVSKMGLTSATPPDPNQVMYVALTDPSSSWFPGGWQNVANTAASKALELLSRDLGVGSGQTPDLSGWEWGTVHTFFLPSILQYKSFGEGPYPQWGDGYTPSVAPFTPALMVPLTQVAIGSSLRMVTAPSDTPAWGVIPGGTSGNVGSVYYDNQLPLWLAHSYVNMSVVSGTSGPFSEGVISTWNLNP